MTRRRPLFGFVSAVLLAAITIVLLQQASRPLYDRDLWWHLRSGEEFLRDWSQIRNPEPLTPFATQDWFSPSWLPEMVFARIELSLGLPGVAWVYGAGLLALTATIYVIARQYSDVLVASLVTFITIAGASGALTPRPQLLSFIFLALVSHAWLMTANDLRPRWWLVALTWVWAMCHGMWIVGILLGVGVVVGLGLDRRLDRETALRLSAVPAASFAAAGLTPQGPRNLLVFTETAGFRDHITEFVPPSLDDPLFLLALSLVGVVVVTHMRTARRLSWAHLAIVAQAAIWMMYTVRSISWGAVIVAPLTAGAMQSWVPQRDHQRMGPFETASLAGGAIIGLIVLALLVPNTASEPGRMPNSLNGELAAIPPDSAILNQYGLGGWIEWRHRHLAPVIDGNTYQFRVSDLEDYISATDLEPGWEDYMTDKGVTHAVLEPDSPLAHALQQRLDWSVTATGEDFVLITAPGSE